jgi:hypothetical protein
MLVHSLQVISSPLFVSHCGECVRLFLRIDGSRILIKDTRIFHDFNSDQVHLEITTRQGQESDYQLPISAIAPSPAPVSSLALPGISARPHPLAPPPAGARPHPLALSGVQLRDSNHMSRILPLKPFQVTKKRCVQRGEGGSGETEEMVEEIVTKPQLTFFLQL